MNVSAQVKQIHVSVYVNGFVRTLEQCPRKFVFGVKRLGVNIENCLHEFADFNIPVLAQKKVIVIVHQTIGNHGDATSLQFFFDALQQKHVICIVAKDVILMCAAIVDVIVVVRQEKDFSASHEVYYTVRVHRTLLNKTSLIAGRISLIRFTQPVSCDALALRG